MPPKEPKEIEVVVVEQTQARDETGELVRLPVGETVTLPYRQGKRLIACRKAVPTKDATDDEKEAAEGAKAKAKKAKGGGAKEAA